MSLYNEMVDYYNSWQRNPKNGNPRPTISPPTDTIKVTTLQGGKLGKTSYYCNIGFQYGSDLGADTARTLVLISPELTSKTIASLITTLKRNLMTCTFSIDEANFYQRVILIDPDHYFTDDDLIRLDNNGVQIEPIRENVVATLKEKLAG